MVDGARAAAERLAGAVLDDLAAAARQRAVAVEAVQAGPLQPGDPRRAVVALALHHWYSAVEAAFERIALELEGLPPKSDRWHQDLLQQMVHELPGVRIAVISAGTANALRSLLQFRHFLRQAYAVDLDPVRLHALLTDLEVAANRLQADIAAWLAWLRRGPGRSRLARATTRRHRLSSGPGCWHPRGRQ